MKTTKISIADIKSISNILKMTLTPLEIDKILSIYEEEEKNDPTATWDLIVENCIYNVKGNLSGWKLTDPDNFQYGMQISESVFKFKEFDRNEYYNLTKEEIEKIPFSDDDYYVELEIDLTKYTSEQIREVVDGYYTNLEELISIYGKDSNWIVAECIFETESGLY